MLWIVAKEISKHVDHQNERIELVKYCCNDGMPETLCVGVVWSGRYMYMHCRCDACENARGNEEEDNRSR